jgi:hypothetical protein
LTSLSFSRGDEGTHGGSPFATAIGTREQPCLSAEGHAAQLAFGCIIRQADPAIGQEPGERVPALEHVIHGLGEVGMPRQPAALLTHPDPEAGHERRDVLVPHAKAVFGRQSVGHL